MKSFIKKIMTLGAVLLLLSCNNDNDPFIQYSKVTKPVKLGDGSLSVDSVQWNNVFVSKTNELYFTKMKKNASVIHKMKYNGTSFQELQEIDFPKGTPHSDMYINKGGDVMLFTSIMQEHEKDTIMDWNIWKSKRINQKWQAPELFFENNVEGNQFYPWLTDSGNIYFAITPHGSGNSDLHVSEYKNGIYQTPKPLPKYINSEAIEGDAFVAPDESYIIFAGFERQENLGKSDLYITFNNKGKWTPPVWLGENINSEGYDGSPFVTEDGKYLIFSSSRGSTDENTFFNHYIIPFNLEKYNVSPDSK